MEELVTRFEDERSKVVQKRIDAIYDLPESEAEKELEQTVSEDFQKSVDKETFFNLGIDVVSDDELEQLLDFFYSSDSLDYGNYDTGWHNW